MAVLVDENREKSRIGELESIRKQMMWWRWGTFGFITVFLTGCVLTLNSSVHGLINPGPTQDQFVQNVNSSLQTETVPTLEHEATETLTEIQPEVKTSVMKLSSRVPEIAQSAEDQLRILQKDLPAKGEDILNRKFATVINSKEAKIKSMYPDVTPDQLKTLVSNLSDHARTQMTQANSDLFGPHQAKLQSILASMDTIRSQEATNVKNEQPDWEMGVLLLDVFRDDLSTLTQQKKSDTSSRMVTENTTSPTTAKAGI